MNKIMVLVAVAALAYGFYGYQQRSRAEKKLAARAVPGMADVCAGRNFCALVYLAPWCPHCKNAVPELMRKAVKAGSSSYPGFRVVVGDGPAEENQAMAKHFGAHGSVDVDRALATKYGVRSYPSYLVLDKEGDVILRDQEAFAWVHEKF